MANHNDHTNNNTNHHPHNRPSVKPLRIASKEYLGVAIDFLSLHLPTACKLYHTLKTCTSPFAERVFSAFPSIYVNSLHPTFINTVLCLYPSSTDYNVCFYTTEEKVLAEMLQQCVDWTRPLELAGVLTKHRHVIQAIQQWCQETQKQDFEVLYEPCYQYQLSDPSLFTPMPLSPDLTARPLAATEEVALHIKQRWPYSSPNSERFILTLLSAFPSTGIYRGEHLIAYAVIQAYGAIGMVHVEREERGKGIGAQLISIVTQQRLEQRQAGSTAASLPEPSSGPVFDEFTPFAFITIKNAVSMRLFSRLGYESGPEIDWAEWILGDHHIDESLADIQPS